MTVVVDTSALMARHLDVPQRSVVTAALDAERAWCASALALAEALALVDRLVDTGEEAATLRRSLHDDWRRFTVVPVDEPCLRRAAELARDQPLRIVDAIHLAAAERLPAPVSFVTFSPTQLAVALALGFEVVSA